MLINFGILKDFKRTDKYIFLQKSLEAQKVKFGSSIQKLKSYQIYKSDIIYVTNKTVKALWTKFRVEEEDCLVLLDVIKGNYDNSKYLKNKLFLKQFFQTGNPINESIKDTDFEDSIYELGEEKDEPFYFFHRKVIKLSPDQETILQKDLHPGFYILAGIAGSGKTSIAYIKLKELYKQQKRCLFTTGNGNLAEYLKEVFLEEEQERGRDVEFYGYNELVDLYYHDVSKLQKVGFNEFEKYIQGKKLGKIKLNHKMLYSLMQYIACKPDIVPGKREFFKDILEKDFKLCVELYNNYLYFSSKEHKIDLSLSPLEVKEDKRFDYIIVDESQDLSPREIENISLLKETNTGTIIFNIDSNQHSNISLPVKYLKSHPNTKEFINILDYSFRLPEIISKYAQRILEVRSLVLQGVPDKDMVRQFSSSSNKKGNIVHIGIEDGTKLFDAANIAVITLDLEGKLTIEQLLPHMTQVFTADEIKGMEYDTIILYDPYIYYSDILLKNHTIPWDKLTMKSNLPKDINLVDHDVKILFNLFFTAVTRVKNNLYILERFPENLSIYCHRFKEYLMKDIENGDIHQADKGTDEDWLNQINLLVINNYISHAIKAYEKRKFTLGKIIKHGTVTLTYELCLIAVLVNIEDLVNVPEMYKNLKFYKEILQHFTFKSVPSTLRNIEFCKVAIDTDINNILLAPFHCLEINEYFLNKFNYLLVEMPHKLLTEELCQMAVKKDFKNNFNDVPETFKCNVYKVVFTEQYNGSLEGFPPELINKTLIKVAVDINIYNLKYVPHILLTDDIYKYILEAYKNSLKDFPTELINKRITEIATNLNPESLLYAPDKFKSFDVYKLALKHFDNSLKKLPDTLYSKSIAEVSVRLDTDNLRLYPFYGSLLNFPTDFITQDIAETAVILDPHNLNFIYKSEKKLNFTKIYKSMLKTYKNSLAKFPKELITKSISTVAVKLNINNLLYLSYNQKKALIHHVIYINDAGLLELLLDKIKRLYTQSLNIYINVNDSNGNIPLLYAAEMPGSKNVIAVLIKYGVHINAQDKNGMTALHCAAKSGNLETFQLLEDHGVNLNVEDCISGRTAFHFAAAQGSFDIVDYLINKNPDIINGVASKSKETALHYAAKNGRLEIVEYLVENGCDIYIPSLYNKTALYYATELGDLDIVKYLYKKSDINLLRPSMNALIECATHKGHSPIVKVLSPINHRNRTT